MNQHITWSPGMTIDQMEREVIGRALAHYRQKKAAATALGIAIRTLDHKLEKYAADDKIASDLRAEQQRAEEAFNLRARGIITTPDHRAVAIVEEVAPTQQVTNLNKRVKANG